MLFERWIVVEVRSELAGGRLRVGQNGALQQPLQRSRLKPGSRKDYQAGEVAQCDLWFPAVDVPLGFGHAGRLPVLAMVSGYSRMNTAIMVPIRQSPDLSAGHWALISGGVGLRECCCGTTSLQSAGAHPQLTGTMNALRGTLGIKVVLCRPGDPEAKGLVQRANGDLEMQFLTGRSSSSPADFNKQLAIWLVATTRAGIGG